MNLDPAMYSRILTATTLGFHIIFATIGVGVPLMIAIAHWIGIKNNDEHYILLAKRWTRGFIITVAVGVVTGTSIGLQLNLLWPSFMEIAGQIISLPLFLEVFAFFLEAIFLGIYIYTWNRFSNPFHHFLLLIPVVIGSSMSAFFITTVNAFMNTPQGFVLENGIIKQIQPLVAMFNPATATKVSHVLVSAYMTSAFVLASIAAYQLIKGKSHAYYKKAFKVTMLAGGIFSISTALVGDFSGKFLAEYQPRKLAAAEWHFETEKNAPLVLYGVLNEGHDIDYAIKIPGGLSFLAHGNFSAKVTGLEEIPKNYWPSLIVHYLFDGMVTIGVFLTLLSLLYFAFKRIRYKKWFLYGALASGPLAVIAIELGWIFTEIARQPWILTGYMLTVDGATTADHVDVLLVVFILLYLLLGIGCATVLRKLFKNHPPEDELKD